MPPMIATNFGDLIAARVAKIYTDRYRQVPDMLAEFFAFPELGPQKDSWQVSEVGAFGDTPEFDGQLDYQDAFQGFLTTLTHKEYASGFQVAVTLFEDEKFQVIDRLPAALGTSMGRTRQKHGSEIFNQAFSVDTTWMSREEGVALCSNTHTTTSGASTTSGFDNLVTAALSAVSLQAAKIQGMYLRDDRGNKIDHQFDTLITPIDLEETAYELIKSAGKVDTANNNVNIHQGRYTHKMWIHITDVNNWFLADAQAMKDSFHFIDRVKASLQQVEDFDTFNSKHRGRQRYSLGWSDWRGIVGAQ